MAVADEKERLTRLMAPVMERAQRTARRLAVSDADGDDLFQEAACRSLLKLHTLRDETAFPFWFFRLLVSVHRSRARNAFWRRHVALEDVPEPLSPSEEPGSAKRLRTALGRLPAVQREAIVLAEVEGYTLKEISVIQEVSESAVKSRVARARKKLRSIYEAEGKKGEAPALHSFG